MDGDQRHLRAPQAGHARGRPRLRRWRARRSAGCAATGWWSPRPPGSTGYNLANAGPILAWGVRGLRRLVHRAALADRAGAGRGARGPADDQQRVARGGRRGPRRRPPGVRAAGGGGHPRRVRRASTGCWRSCRGRASTTGCASGSGGSRARGARRAWQAPRPSRVACAAWATALLVGEGGGGAGCVEWHLSRGMRGSGATRAQWHLRSRLVPLDASRGSVAFAPSSVHARRSPRALRQLCAASATNRAEHPGSVGTRW